MVTGLPKPTNAQPLPIKRYIKLQAFLCTNVLLGLCIVTTSV